MPLFTCPHCGRQIEVDRAGQRVLCGSCGESVYIAAATTAARPRPAVAVPTPAVAAQLPNFRVTPGKRKKKNPWPNVAIHCLISATAMVAAYKFIIEPRLNQPKPAKIVTSPEAAKPKLRPRIAPVVPAPVVPELDPPKPLPKDPEPPAWAAKQSKPFEGFPSFVDLPPVTETKTVGITGRVDAKLDLLAFDETLKIDGTKIVHSDKTIAGIRVGDGLIEFKWSKEAPPESVAAVRNSVLKLTSAGTTHHIALRAPVKAKAPVMELAQSSFRIYAKCDAPPHHSHVRFTFDLAAQLPVKVLEGEANGMKAGDEVLLQYDTAGDAATKVSVRPAGAVLCADFATQYQLPSGDVEPLTISRGNRKLKQLNSLHSQAIDAQQSIGKLRSYYQSLESSLRRAQRSGGARDGYAPLVHAQMAVAAGSINREMVATNKQIIRAERLIEDKPGIEADLQEIQEIADLAQSIKGTPIPYRFFMMIEGVEVDLVVAE